MAIDNTAVAIGLGSAAGPRWCGTAAPSELPVALTALLTGFATAAASGQSLTPMRDLPDDLRAMLAAAARLGPPTVPRSRPAAPRAGILEMPDGGAGVVVAPPFGRLEAGQLIEVAGWAERFGDGEVRLSPWRGIVFPSVRPEHLAALTALASGAGLIAEPGDPRLAVFACPGQPGLRQRLGRDAARCVPARRSRRPAAARRRADPCFGVRQGLRPSRCRRR